MLVAAYKGATCVLFVFYDPHIQDDGRSSNTIPERHNYIGHNYTGINTIPERQGIVSFRRPTAKRRGATADPERQQM